MPYAAVTRATLRARLQDRYTGDPFWSAAEANDALNEALRYFNLYTGYWRGSATAVTAAANPFLSVPGTLTYRTRITRTGYPLTRKSIVELFRFRRNWRTQTTTSGGEVPTVIREWAPIGLATLAIRRGGPARGLFLSFQGVKGKPNPNVVGELLDLGEEEIALIL